MGKYTLSTLVTKATDHTSIHILTESYVHFKTYPWGIQKIIGNILLDDYIIPILVAHGKKGEQSSFI